MRNMGGYRSDNQRRAMFANMTVRKLRMDREKVGEYVDSKVGGSVYVRALPEGEHFDENKFCSSHSFDEFVVEQPKTLKEAEELVEKYGLQGKAKRSRHPRLANFGIEYDGVNATQFYDPVQQGHGELVLFEGEYLGDNLHRSGDIVKPKKALELIELLEKN